MGDVQSNVLANEELNGEQTLTAQIADSKEAGDVPMTQEQLLDDIIARLENGSREKFSDEELSLLVSIRRNNPLAFGRFRKVCQTLSIQWRYLEQHLNVFENGLNSLGPVDTLFDQIAQRSDTSSTNANEQSSEPPSNEGEACALALSFLNENGFVQDKTLLLRFWRHDFYVYQDNQFSLLPTHEIRAMVARWLISGGGSIAGTKRRNDVMSDLEGICLLSSKKDAPFFVNSQMENGHRFVALKSGILDVEGFLNSSSNPLIPHTPDFFSLGVMPFSFDPNAKCPTWEKFLVDSLPDEESRMFIQEWFGYNIVYDISQHRFVVFVGEGANGKSVVCMVLRLLLGENNVSSVSLESFNTQRTFPLAQMTGKLANIVEEIGEVTNVAEGLLKQIVAGGSAQVEKKFKDPMTMEPTARLTFATNVLPRFVDRTRGIWRRLTVIPFTVQFLEEEKQDKRLAQARFWIESGEMSGILNWALEGLVRLKQRGHFLEPKVSLVAKENYKLDCNPAQLFLLDHFEQSKDARYSSHEAYSGYRTFCQENGFTSLNSRNFTEEVKRTFPAVYQEKNPTWHGGRRVRMWRNLLKIEDNSGNGTNDTKLRYFASNYPRFGG